LVVADACARLEGGMAGRHRKLLATSRQWRSTTSLVSSLAPATPTHSSAASTRPLCSSLRANILYLREAGVISISRSYCRFGGLELRPQLQNVCLEPDARPCRTRPRPARFYFEV
jgi:hypothetical protein